MKRFLSIGECMVEFADLGNGTFAQGFAGDTFNTAWYARKLLPPSWTVEYFTAVGDDRMSEDMCASMAASGIDTRHIARVPGTAPGLYVITLRNGERSFSYWRDTSAARQLARDDSRLAEACRAADVIYFSGITLAILPPKDAAALLACCTATKAAGKMVAYDPNYRARLWAGRIDAQDLAIKAAAAATIVLTGCDDEDTLFANREPQAIAARYLAAGANEIVVKDGANGATIFFEGHAIAIPAAPSPSIVDTTAAGDSFNAAYLAARLQGETPQMAAEAAARVAAQVIANYGALVPVSA